MHRSALRAVIPALWAVAGAIGGVTLLGAVTVPVTLALRQPEAREPEPPAAAAAPYWLVATAIELDDPGSRVRDEVRTGAPILVALSDGGRVRSLGGKPWSGHVDVAALSTPQATHGLFLYAQRKTELRLRTLTGPVLGWLHPGAFVAVAPGHDRAAPIAVATWDLDFVAAGIVVDRGALGPTPRPLEPPVPPPGVRVTEGLPLSLWTVPSRPGTPVFQAVTCRDLWHDPKSRAISQWVDGIELRGFDSDSAPPDRSYPAQERCPAGAVVQRDGHLWLTTPDPRGRELVEPITPSEIPRGYARYAPPQPDPLAHAIATGGLVYWMKSPGIDAPPRCEGWRFELEATGPLQRADDEVESRAHVAGVARAVDLRRRGRPAPGAPLETGLRCAESPHDPGCMGAHRATASGRLVFEHEVDWDERGPTWLYFPFEYYLATDEHPAQLVLETLHARGEMVMRCYCDQRYRLVAAPGGELHVIGNPLPGDNDPPRLPGQPLGSLPRPSDLVAYDLANIERWFLSRDDCERAVAAAAAPSAPGGPAAKVAGLHASYD